MRHIVAQGSHGVSLQGSSIAAGVEAWSSSKALPQRPHSDNSEGAITNTGVSPGKRTTVTSLALRGAVDMVVSSKDVSDLWCEISLGQECEDDFC